MLTLLKSLPEKSVDCCWLGLWRCDCGTEKKIPLAHVKSGKIQSCGCVRIRHGMWKSPEYRCWIQMRGRCTNTNAPNYSDYGGRGISVCDRWQSFDNFLADMGMRPSENHSIDRRDNNGSYEPSNCYWATQDEQCINRRCSYTFIIRGQSFPSAKEAANAFGVTTQTIREWTKGKRGNPPKAGCVAIKKYQEQSNAA